MTKLYYDADADLSLLHGRRIAVIGYGSQGHAHALNLKESGCDVIVGVRPGLRGLGARRGRRLAAAEPGGRASSAPTSSASSCPTTSRSSSGTARSCPRSARARPCSSRTASTSTSARSSPPKDVDVIMVAPKGPGHLVRRLYSEGEGVPCLIAIEQDATGEAQQTGARLGLGHRRRARRACSRRRSPRRPGTDLFGEQAVLCGGASALVQAGFETLVAAGYQPEIAYFECLHELKLIVDLMYEGGLAGMRYSISDTAEYGDLTRGPADRRRPRARRR